MIRRPPAGGLFCVRWGRVFSFLSPTGCFLASGGLFSFNSERKEEKKRRQKLRFWISLRGFTWFLSCLLLPRERRAMQILLKYCTVSASWSAAAFALKYRRINLYRGWDQRQRRGRRGVIPWPPLGGGWQREALTGGENEKHTIYPSGASRHLPRRGRQGRGYDNPSITASP